MKPRKFLNFAGTGVAVLGIALCIPATMLAQDTPPQSNSQGQLPMHRHHGQNPERQLKHLTKMLNLTADQQQQMLPILQDQHKQMKSMRNDTSLSPQQRRQQRQTMMQDTHQKLEAIMTESQKQQFEQAMQQRRDHMRNRGMGQGQGQGIGTGGTPPPPPPDGQTPPPPPPQQ